AGVVWIGMLYFFNWVNGPFAATMDADTKKKVVPELMPRALYWFRWGAAWTWITGLLLLMLVFYHGQILFDDLGGWRLGAMVMVTFVFVAPLFYDKLQQSPLGKDPKTFGAVAFVLVAVVAFLMATWAGFGYRALNIHLGGMFGTIMAFNVWYRIWPAQQKIITAVKNGTAPDAALVSLAGTRSRHNVYMSVPLLWAMINQHTVTVTFGLPARYAFVVFLVVVLLAWHIVWQLYKRAPKVKGF
ncbi:MAG TPA: urate hydroxylase PuuD, partial [Vicinamibacteria bacterium]